MKNILKICIALLVLACPRAWAIAPVFQCSFENSSDTTGWNFLTNGDVANNAWTIGEATSYDGSHSLYVSADDGENNGYTDDAIYYLTTYKKIVLNRGNYKLSFVYKVRGESGESLYMTFNSSRPTATSASNWSTRSNSMASIDNAYNNSEWLPNAPMWTTFSKDFIIAEDSTVMYLTFLWKTNGNHLANCPGACIDFIQIAELPTGFDCAAAPKLLTHRRQGNNAVFSWSATASEYQVEYFVYDNPRIHTVDYVTSTNYVIPSSDIDEGVYTFRVRSICGTDTSAWTKLDYVLIYDISAHCMDYLNFYDPDVKAQYGSTSNPYSTTEVYDRGYWASNSRHTIHYIPGETDPRTRNRLKTTPDDQVASVRLGNWEYNAKAEGITYNLPITQDDAVLLMQYAIVMQDPNHTKLQQPRFTLELLDSTGVLVDSCAFADFMAASNMDGWITDSSFVTPVIWKDWTLVGMNMQPYIGQTLKVRLTTKDCSNGEHYGYAYFTLACSDGKVKGLQCGQKPDTLTATEGFNYRWYRKYDNPQTVLCRQQTYVLANSLTDTATYCVDLIQKTDSQCYYTLEVSSLAYEPAAQFAVNWTPASCENFIQIVDSSYIKGFCYDNMGNKVEVTKLVDAIDDYYWECESSIGKQTSTLRNPKFRVPNAGDTLHITLTTAMEGGCEDTMDMFYYAAPVGDVQTVETHYICHGDTMYYHGKAYFEEGNYTDTLIAWTGCDSLFTISIRYMHIDTLHYYDTLCQVELPNEGYYWETGNQYITQGGDYYYMQKTFSGCDSVYHIMHFLEHKKLIIDVDTSTQVICMGNGDIILPYTLVAGEATAYSLLFNQQEHNLGFADQIEVPITTHGNIEITIDDIVWPGYYSATMLIYNLNCDSVKLPININVMYDPDSIITQRWADFLSIRKTAYDYYGGFADYQWYLDGEPISGQTGTQIYVPEEGLNMGAEYSVVVTRLSDGVRIGSCGFIPKSLPNTVTLRVTPTYISSAARMPLSVDTEIAGLVNIYDESGIRVSSSEVELGHNNVLPPYVAGFYMLQFVGEDGSIHVTKFVVE